MKDLAILIPSFNGGVRLRHSVESCAGAGLAPERYALLVIDNCSTDGSIEALPARDAGGVQVQVYRNEVNIGRVANWNRALEIAQNEGFQFVTFLFVGDTWVPRSSVADLLNLMKQGGAVLGMGPLSIKSEDGRRSRRGARFTIPTDSALVESQELLQSIARTGRLPFAPLQANIYRVFSDSPLRFDPTPRNALNTDIESTVNYLLEHDGKVALVAKPFIVWRESSRRYLGTQDPWFVMKETRASLWRVGEATGLRINWRSANAISLLTSAYELSRKMPVAERIAFVWRVCRYLRRAPDIPLHQASFTARVRRRPGFRCPTHQPNKR